MQHPRIVKDFFRKSHHTVSGNDILRCFHRLQVPSGKVKRNIQTKDMTTEVVYQELAI